MALAMQSCGAVSRGFLSASNAVAARGRQSTAVCAKTTPPLKSQFVGDKASLLKKSSVLENVHACRSSQRISASAIEAPKTGTSGSGKEFEASPKQTGQVSNTSHSGYENPPKKSTSAGGAAAAPSSGQEHTGYNAGDPVRPSADSDQKHTAYENQAEDAHAEKGGAQGHAEYKEGEREDPQGGAVSQSHAAYENPPAGSPAGEASKQGHSSFQASGRSASVDVLALSGVNGPVGARLGSSGARRTASKLGRGVMRSKTVARATGAAVAASGQKQSHAIKAPATVFVAGATGATGQKIVKALLARGLRVKAGVRNVNSAREKLGPPPTHEEHLELVEASVTGGVDALAAALKGTDAVVSALGARPSFNFKQPWEVDCQGNIDLAKACEKAGVKKLVVVSALLTNGAKLGQFLNPAYIILNIFGLTLLAKHRAEEYIWKTGLDYTIVRPGGLDRGPAGSIVLGKEDTIFGGSVPREQVAEVAAEALLLPEASYKVVEVISKQGAPAKKLQELFAAVPSVPH